MVSPLPIPPAPRGWLAPLLQHGVLPLQRYQAGAMSGWSLVPLPALRLLSAHWTGVSAATGRADKTQWQLWSVSGIHRRVVSQQRVCCQLLGYKLRAVLLFLWFVKNVSKPSHKISQIKQIDDNDWVFLDDIECFFQTLLTLWFYAAAWYNYSMFLGVLFALKVVSNHYNPGGATYVLDIGVSNCFASWVELVLIYLIAPGWDTQTIYDQNYPWAL